MEGNAVIHSYKELIVWQRAKQLAVATYILTQQFPNTERYGLVSQIQRSAVAIASNIAEGRTRGSRKDFLQYLRIAYASGAELETQIAIAQELPATTHLQYQRVNTLLLEVMKMLNTMIRRMNPKIT